MLIILTLLLYLFSFSISTPLYREQLPPEHRAECPITKSSKFSYRAGDRYVYQYEGKSRISIQDQKKSEAETLLMWSATVALDWISPCQVVVSVHNPVVGGKSGNELIREHLAEKPLIATIKDGVVIDVLADPKDHPAGLNFKKGIVAQLQNVLVSLTTFVQQKTFTESDTVGDCPTLYSVEDVQDSFKVTKVKNHKQCRYRKNEKSQSLFTSLLSKLPLSPLNETGSTCVQTIGKLYPTIVRSVQCSDRNVFASVFGNRIEAVQDSVLTFKNEEKSQALTMDKFRKTDLKFEELTQPRTERYKPEVDKILKHLCQDIKVHYSSLTSSGYVAFLIKLIHPLHERDIAQILTNIREEKYCSDSRRLESLYLTAMAFVQGGGGVKTIVQDVMQNRDSEARQLLYTLGLHLIRNPDIDSMKAIKPLFESENVPTHLTLAAAGLVYRYCQNHSECCEQPEIQELQDILSRKIRSSCLSSSSPKQKETAILAMKSIKNMAIATEQARESLKLCVQSAEADTFVRVVASQAMQRLPCDQQPTSELLDIAIDPSENEEVRIASYVACVKCLNYTQAEILVQNITTEASTQVRAFILSHLSNLQRSNAPHNAHLSYMLQTFDLPRDYERDLRKYSRHLDWSYYIPSLGLGADVETSVIYTPGSWFPRTIQTNITANVFNQVMNVGEFGLRDVGAFLNSIVGRELQKLIKLVLRIFHQLKHNWGGEGNLSSVESTLFKLGMQIFEQLKESLGSERYLRTVKSPMFQNIIKLGMQIFQQLKERYRNGMQIFEQLKETFVSGFKIDFSKFEKKLPMSAEFEKLDQLSLKDIEQKLVEFLRMAKLASVTKIVNDAGNSESDNSTTTSPFFASFLGQEFMYTTDDGVPIDPRRLFNEAFTFLNEIAFNLLNLNIDFTKTVQLNLDSFIPTILGIPLQTKFVATTVLSPDFKSSYKNHRFETDFKPSVAVNLNAFVGFSFGSKVGLRSNSNFTVKPHGKWQFSWQKNEWEMVYDVPKENVILEFEMDNNLIIKFPREGDQIMSKKSQPTNLTFCWQGFKKFTGLDICNEVLSTDLVLLPLGSSYGKINAKKLSPDKELVKALATIENKPDFKKAAIELIFPGAETPKKAEVGTEYKSNQQTKSLKVYSSGPSHQMQTAEIDLTSRQSIYALQARWVMYHAQHGRNSTPDEVMLMEAQAGFKNNQLETTFDLETKSSLAEYVDAGVHLDVIAHVTNVAQSPWKFYLLQSFEIRKFEAHLKVPKLNLDTNSYIRQNQDSKYAVDYVIHAESVSSSRTPNCLLHGQYQMSDKIWKSTTQINSEWKAIFGAVQTEMILQNDDQIHSWKLIWKHDRDVKFRVHTELSELSQNSNSIRAELYWPRYLPHYEIEGQVVCHTEARCLVKAIVEKDEKAAYKLTNAMEREKNAKFFKLKSDIELEVIRSASKYNLRTKLYLSELKNDLQMILNDKTRTIFAVEHEFNRNSRLSTRTYTVTVPQLVDFKVSSERSPSKTHIGLNGFIQPDTQKSQSVRAVLHVDHNAKEMSFSFKPDFGKESSLSEFSFTSKYDLDLPRRYLALKGDFNLLGEQYRYNNELTLSEASEQPNSPRMISIAVTKDDGQKLLFQARYSDQYYGLNKTVPQEKSHFKFLFMNPSDIKNTVRSFEYDYENSEKHVTRRGNFNLGPVMVTGKGSLQVFKNQDFLIIPNMKADFVVLHQEPTLAIKNYTLKISKAPETTQVDFTANDKNALTYERKGREGTWKAKIWTSQGETEFQSKKTNQGTIWTFYPNTLRSQEKYEGKIYHKKNSDSKTHTTVEVSYPNSQRPYTLNAHYTYNKQPHSFFGRFELDIFKKPPKLFVSIAAHKPTEESYKLETRAHISSRNFEPEVGMEVAWDPQVKIISMSVKTRPEQKPQQQLSISVKALKSSKSRYVIYGEVFNTSALAEVTAELAADGLGGYTLNGTVRAPKPSKRSPKQSPIEVAHAAIVLAHDGASWDNINNYEISELAQIAFHLADQGLSWSSLNSTIDMKLLTEFITGLANHGLSLDSFNRVFKPHTPSKRIDGQEYGPSEVAIAATVLGAQGASWDNINNQEIKKLADVLWDLVNHGQDLNSLNGQQASQLREFIIGLANHGLSLDDFKRMAKAMSSSRSHYAINGIVIKPSDLPGVAHALADIVGFTWEKLNRTAKALNSSKSHYAINGVVIKPSDLPSVAHALAISTGYSWEKLNRTAKARYSSNISHIVNGDVITPDRLPSYITELESYGFVWNPPPKKTARALNTTEPLLVITTINTAGKVHDILFYGKPPLSRANHPLNGTTKAWNYTHLYVVNGHLMTPGMLFDIIHNGRPMPPWIDHLRLNAIKKALNSSFDIPASILDEIDDLLNELDEIEDLLNDLAEISNIILKSGPQSSCSYPHKSRNEQIYDFAMSFSYPFYVELATKTHGEPGMYIARAGVLGRKLPKVSLDLVAGSSRCYKTPLRFLSHLERNFSPYTRSEGVYSVPIVRFGFELSNASFVKADSFFVRKLWQDYKTTVLKPLERRFSQLLEEVSEHIPEEWEQLSIRLPELSPELKQEMEYYEHKIKEIFSISEQNLQLSEQILQQYSDLFEQYVQQYSQLFEQYAQEFLTYSRYASDSVTDALEYYLGGRMYQLEKIRQRLGENVNSIVASCRCSPGTAETKCVEEMWDCYNKIRQTETYKNIRTAAKESSDWWTQLLNTALNAISDGLKDIFNDIMKFAAEGLIDWFTNLFRPPTNRTVHYSEDLYNVASSCQCPPGAAETECKEEMWDCFYNKIRQTETYKNLRATAKESSDWWTQLLNTALNSISEGLKDIFNDIMKFASGGLIDWFTNLFRPPTNRTVHYSWEDFYNVASRSPPESSNWWTKLFENMGTIFTEGSKFVLNLVMRLVFNNAFDLIFGPILGSLLPIGRVIGNPALLGNGTLHYLSPQNTSDYVTFGNLKFTNDEILFPDSRQNHATLSPHTGIATLTNATLTTFDGIKVPIKPSARELLMAEVYGDQIFITKPNYEETDIKIKLSNGQKIKIHLNGTKNPLLKTQHSQEELSNAKITQVSPRKIQVSLNGMTVTVRTPTFVQVQSNFWAFGKIKGLMGSNDNEKSNDVPENIQVEY